MSQFLTLPINDCVITASYKSETYKNQWGFNHFGMDCVSKIGDTAIYSPGDGAIVACGLDGENAGERLGLCMVAVFSDVSMPGGKTMGLACRVFHLNKILVKPGDIIKKGQIIGHYGNTGKYTSGAHLHIEFDMDVLYPAYAYGIAGGGKIILKGNVDSTINPAKVMYLGANQKIAASSSSINQGWVFNDDVALFPTLGAIDGIEAHLAQVTAQRDALQKKIEAALKILS